MKLNKWLWIAAALAAGGRAQETGLTIGNPAWNGLTIRCVAKVEPSANGAPHLPGAVMPTADGAHRWITDSANKRYFGYDVHLEPLGESQTMRLTLAPLNLPRSGTGAVETIAGWTLLAPPKFPVIPVMRAGDTVAIDLMVNPATGQRVVDYLSVERRAPEAANAAKTPQDFGIEDIELKLLSPRVWLNGKIVEATAESGGGITAHALWLYLPGTGSFILSLRPEAGLGFQKAGTVTGSTLTFRQGPSEYRVECSGQIAPGPGLYNVYVLHDPVWRGGDKFVFGGADKAAWLIQKR